jgi:hypothetical protein
MKKKAFICFYLLVTGLLCIYFIDPYLTAYVHDKGLKYAAISIFWLYCFCNPYIILGAFDFQKRSIL